MKDIVQAMDVLAAGFLAFTIYSGLLSKLLFGYLVIRFILKNAIK